MEREAFVRALFEQSAKRGGTAEVCIEASSSFEVEVKNGEVHQYSVSDAMGLGFRVLKDGRTGTASTQILDEDAVGELVDGAFENAELSESTDEQFMYPGDPQYPKLSLYNPAVAALTAAEKIEMARTLERLTLAQDERVTQVETCAVFSTVDERLLANTLGLNVSAKSALLGGYVVAVARDGEAVNTGMKLFVTMDPADVDLEAVARKAVREAVDGLGGGPVKSGPCRVLLRNDVAAALLSTFSGIFSADNAQKGLSRLKGLEGEAVAAPCVTLLDDPHRPDSPSSAAFDGEGVATRRKAVIESGTLTTLLHNLKTARKQGVQTTANAARTSYAAPVGIAPTNFHFVPTDRRFEDMLRITGDGLLITDVQGLHAGANAVTGDFSLAARGFKIEGGALGAPVRQITVAGNFYQLLKDIEALGGDLDFRAPGVSRFGSPSLLVRSLSVAGV